MKIIPGRGDGDCRIAGLEPDRVAKRPVYRLDRFTFAIIERFDALSAAARSAKVPRKCMIAAILDGWPIAGSYWCFADASIPAPASFSHAPVRPVMAIEPDTREVLAVFPSKADAARAMSLADGTSISKAVRTGARVRNLNWANADEPMPDRAFFSDGGRCHLGVVCVDENRWFPSIGEACKRTRGVSRSSLVRALRDGGTAGGYRWRYAEASEFLMRRAVPLPFSGEGGA